MKLCIDNSMISDSSQLKWFAAPLQGYTDAAWRHFHRLIYGGDVDCYFTPFLRVEDGCVRKRDVRDITSSLNENMPVVPQIIFRNMAEFRILLECVVAAGFHRVDMNFGCPFPPQVKHGRGAAMLRKPELLSELINVINHEYGNISFSVKMRLGVELDNEWKTVIDYINEMNLSHVTVHPRVAVQQYGGDLHINAFVELMSACRHPVVFNGDIFDTTQPDQILDRFPDLYGIMLGRGLLARPSLIAEIKEGCDWSLNKRLERLTEFHRKLYIYYSGILCGDAQLLSKIKSFWDYAEPEIGHKAFKRIKKANSVTKYNDAVAEILT